MTHRLFLMGTLFTLSVLIAACGTAALPQYDIDSTSVAVARTATRQALFTQGAIIPTDTPTVTPSPTVDFAATDAAIQATSDAEAAIAAELEATTNAEAAAAQAELDAQATADAEAEAQAAAAQPGADDPLFEAIAAADPVNGEMIFTAMAVPTCNTCHLADTDARLVGPGQYNILARTIERIDNGTIEADGPYSYLYNSIVNPTEYIVESYPNAMPATYGDLLSEEQLYDLVAYLASLGD